MSVRHTHHLGVYALILSEDKSEILLIKKNRGPYKGLYDLPGGSLEPGEDLEQTLIREVKEETDCTVTEFDQMGAYTAFFPYHDAGISCQLRHVGVLYDIVVTGTPNEAGDGEDSDGCVWVPLADLAADNSSAMVMIAYQAWQKK